MAIKLKPDYATSTKAIIEKVLLWLEEYEHK